MEDQWQKNYTCLWVLLLSYTISLSLMLGVPGVQVMVGLDCFLYSRHLGDSEDYDSLHCMYMKEIISVHVHVHAISGQATSKPLYKQDMCLVSQQQ